LSQLSIPDALTGLAYRAIAAQPFPVAYARAIALPLELDPIDQVARTLSGMSRYARMPATGMDSIANVRNMITSFLYYF
jgi:hypothetical protein